MLQLTNVETLQRCYLIPLRSFRKLKVYLYESWSFVGKDTMKTFLMLRGLGPFQTPCLSRAELNSLFKFDFGTAVARRLKPFKN